MNIKEKVLYGREERAKLINRYHKEYPTVISVRANIPGVDKNSYLSYLLVNAFSFLISVFDDCESYYLKNDDGPYIIILLSDEDTLKIKQNMIDIENNHILGRFIDIDVYNEKGPVSRDIKRKCFLCDDYAYNCIRKGKHELNEVIDFVEKSVKSYYSNIIKKSVEESILAELDLNPKFGLVTPLTSGSHPDMDYSLMLVAKDTIIPYLLEMFFVSCETKEENILIYNLKKIGISAETAMFEATNGVNAYKGLIFNLGLIISSLGFNISRYIKDDIFNTSQKFSHLIFNDYNFKSNSYGDYAYNKYQILGIKGEALSGFINVKAGLSILKDYSWTSKMETLIYYIINIEDTSFLKRAKTIDFYNIVKNTFREFNLDDKSQIIELNDFCVENNLSFGGSADLLVLTVFIKKLIDLSLVFI